MSDILFQFEEHLRDRRVILYGTGIAATDLFITLLERGITVAFVCDKEKRGVFGTAAIPIISPEKLTQDYQDAVVIIGSITYENEILANLIRLGFQQNQIELYPRAYVFEKHRHGYAWAHEFFTDERSKRLVTDLARMHTDGAPMEINSDSPRYYEEGIITLGENEVFVDGGAYTGESVIPFINRVNNRYDHVYAFEPDSVNYKKAVQALSVYPAVEVVQKGLWSVATELFFAENNVDRAASAFRSSDDAGIRVPVTSLDAFFQGKSTSEWPTFIKMDIEGSEKEALLGAAEIIRQVKPKMAICAYHKLEDIYELPQTITNIRGDYRFCLRQHYAGAWDTVLYAV